ncbi:MAG: ABC transporter substrate-binding protein [Solirubrobacteraceae bacterium]
MLRIRLLGAVAALVLLAASVAACGSSSSGSGSSAKAAPGQFNGDPPGQGKRGGHLTVLAVGDVDYADPGLTYYQFGYMIHYAVNRDLYSYGPGDTAMPRPDLATGAPEISADKKTITVHLRPGVRYAPPVNREVRAADVKYAFERAFSMHVASSYASVYFRDIVGAPATPGAIRPIPGIQTPDHTIVFKLTKPSAALVSQALPMPISTPVPEEYARRFDAKTPSTYDNYVAFTGPYMYKNDASGKLIGRQPGRSIELVRNPTWSAKTDYRPAYLDQITVQEGNDDAVSSARRVLAGSALIQGDGSTPAPVIKQALAGKRDQIAFIPGGSYRMIAMNSAIKPFGNLDVRKAVLAASDRTALQLTRGGVSAGDLATHFLPPAFPGFAEAGGAKGPGADFLAARLQDQVPHRAPGHALHEVLQRAQGAGRHLPERRLRQGLQRPAVAAGPRLQRQERPAREQLELVAAQRPGDQRGDGEGGDARPRPGPRQGVGRIDDMVTAQAPAIPYLWDKIPTIKAADVRGVTNPYTTAWDLTFTSLK